MIITEAGGVIFAQNDFAALALAKTKKLLGNRVSILSNLLPLLMGRLQTKRVRY